MVKYKRYFQDMLSYHKELFDEFRLIHDKYSEDPKRYQDEFNEKGQQVLTIIRRYENSLCGKSEAGKYGKFSSKLADKFWEEIRSVFPKIDFVGVSEDSLVDPNVP